MSFDGVLDSVLWEVPALLWFTLKKSWVTSCTFSHYGFILVDCWSLVYFICALGR